MEQRASRLSGEIPKVPADQADIPDTGSFISMGLPRGENRRILPHAMGSHSEFHDRGHREPPPDQVRERAPRFSVKV